MHDHDIVITAAKRTPLGNFQGCFTPLSATQLGQQAIKATLEQSTIAAEAIDSVIMGCVLPAGLGMAPARQAAINAGLPISTGCTTINKMCGSGMKAVMLAHDVIKAGSQDIIIAGGMESMTNAPYLMPQARQGYRMGNKTVIDHMLFDGLTDGFNKKRLMGSYAEDCAQHYNFTREAQDAFALTSIARAQKAQKEGLFQNEITAVTVKNRKQESLVDQDEGPQTARPEKIPNLRPAFLENGTVTAANSSSISDGAAALQLMTAKTAKEKGLKPLAVIKAHSTHSQLPEWFTTAPVEAVKKVVAKSNWSMDDVDLFEINEAFAVVTMAAMQELHLNHEKVNINGGACVLGHPIGCSGARILVTLLYALQTQQKQRGVASLCIGGGEATAIAIEVCL